MNCIVLVLNWVLRSQFLQSVLVYNFTNMCAMSSRSDLVARSCRVNSYKPAVCYTVTLLFAVFRVRIPSFLILTTRVDCKSLNTSLLEVVISSKNEGFFIRDLSDLTFQITFDSWWASMNTGSKRPISWNNYRHAPSWQFYLDCATEMRGSPGIICIVCHQVLCHPSGHGTSWMGKHLLAKAYIVKLNKFTQSGVTELTSLMVNETALAILKRQGSRGITIVNSYRQIIFDIQVIPYWSKSHTKRSKLAANDFETCGFHHDTSSHYLMLGCVSFHIQWNAISTLELRQS